MIRIRISRLRITRIVVDQMNVDSSVHLFYHDPSDLGSLILIWIISKERNLRFSFCFFFCFFVFLFFFSTTEVFTLFKVINSFKRPNLRTDPFRKSSKPKLSSQNIPGFGHVTILIPSFQGFLQERLGPQLSFCVLNTTKKKTASRLLGLQSLAAYASETNNKPKLLVGELLIPLWLRHVDDTFTGVHKDIMNTFTDRTRTHSLPRRSSKMLKVPFLDCLVTRHKDRLRGKITVNRHIPTDQTRHRTTQHLTRLQLYETLTRRTQLVCQSSESLQDFLSKQLFLQ